MAPTRAGTQAKRVRIAPGRRLGRGLVGVDRALAAGAADACRFSKIMRVCLLKFYLGQFVIPQWSRPDTVMAKSSN
jgi:hypothetical protein